jgi:hypothetical protein
MHHTDATPRGLTANASEEGRTLVPPSAGSPAWASKHLALIGALALGACTSPRLPVPAPPHPPSTPGQPPAAAARPLPPPASSAPYRNWDEFRLHAGRRLVQANPNGTFTGAVPEPLLAIPVLEVELNADGSVRNILVQRHPRQAHDTVQLAIAAVQRAAPFGDVSHLPRPWKFSEVFLFRDDRRFKPRTLDL